MTLAANVQCFAYGEIASAGGVPKFLRGFVAVGVGLWSAFFSLHKPALMATTVSQGQSFSQRGFISSGRLYDGGWL